MMIFFWLLLGSLSHTALSQESPCPDVFHYEPRNQEPGKWYGVILARSPDNLSGIWITVKLDSRAELLGNWFGETYSTDNQEFKIANQDYTLEAGPPVSIRFFVKYDPSKSAPRVRLIRLNGKTVCSEDMHELRTTTPKLHISKPQLSRQPSLGSGLSYEPNGNSSFNDELTTIRRPSHGSSSSHGKPSTSTSSNNNYNIVDSGIGPLFGVDTNNSNNRSRPVGDDRRGSNNNNRPNDYDRQNSNRIGEEDFNSNYRPTENYNRPSSSSNGVHSSIDANSRRPTQSNNRFSGTREDSTSRNANSDEDFFQGDFHSNNRPPRPAGPDTSRPVECGTVVSQPRPLITNGQDTVPGEWPWHVAIYHTKGIQLVYICGASLISEKFVLTAAHCVSKPRSNHQVDASSILLYFGKYNLKTFGPEVQDRDVSEIFIHPQFNYSLYFNDLALLKLSRPVEITDYVRPCCLWGEDTSLESVTDKEGTVIGWGFDQHKRISEKLMQAKMPVVSTIKCIYSKRDFFARFTFDKNFCAGFLNGTSVCNGDSGGSMVFKKRGSSAQSPVWQIRGIVSVGVALQSEGVCDTSQYVIFTDVAKHLDWIKRIIRN
ncbi:unnamed protein product [Phyllotreta striolata]|uniref:Peptidase S1 domain-containing protein n=1 Tax=Phyllotreta striolata TaxID=444603 RepID=A0A9N9TTG1_PHYSR|nr:unnamed protein product [Phyllotreta striolata]